MILAHRHGQRDARACRAACVARPSLKTGDVGDRGTTPEQKRLRRGKLHRKTDIIASDPAARAPDGRARTRMTTGVDHRGDLPGRWMDIDGLLLRAGNVTGPGFEPGEDVKTVLHDMVHVLVVGAGGLGCELLKDLGAFPRDARFSTPRRDGWRSLLARCRALPSVRAGIYGGSVRTSRNPPDPTLSRTFASDGLALRCSARPAHRLTASSRRSPAAVPRSPVRFQED